MSPRANKFHEQTANHFYQLLHHLGWSLKALEEPARLGGLSRPVTVQLAPLPDGKLMLLVFVTGVLPTLEHPYAQFEDLTPLHRELQLALRRQDITTREALLIDEQLNGQLIDLEREDVLLDARGEEDLSDRILPLLRLNSLARGSLTTFPRKSIRQRARELHDWTKVWSHALGAASHTNQETASHFFYWLHLARLAERLGIGPVKKRRFAEYAETGTPLQPVRYLMSAFQPLREHWNLLQASSLETQKNIANRAHEEGKLIPCLESFAHLSESKFASDIFAQAFADEELRVIGWRHSLTEKDERPDEDPMRWLTGPRMTVELDRVGFPGLLRKFDRIAEDLQLLAREQAVARERGERPGLQMDLLGGDPPPIEEEDAPRLVVQHALSVRTHRRDRAEAARFVLLAHSAEWQARLRRPEPVFPGPNVVVAASGGGAAKPLAGQSDPGAN